MSTWRQVTRSSKMAYRMSATIVRVIWFDALLKEEAKVDASSARRAHITYRVPIMPEYAKIVLYPNLYGMMNRRIQWRWTRPANL